MMSSPTALEPVNAITCTPGWRTSAAPASPNPGQQGERVGRDARLVQRLHQRERRTPATARPASAPTALPATSAAAVIPAGMASGKFHGEITAATPRGS